jgi:hypothetical protein
VSFTEQLLPKFQMEEKVSEIKSKVKRAYHKLKEDTFPLGNLVLELEK